MTLEFEPEETNVNGYGTKRLVRRAAAVALASVVLYAAPAAAQWETTFVGVGEVGGDEVNLILGQLSLHPAGIGFQPVVSLQSYYLDFPGGNTISVTPAAGLRYRAEGGQLQAKVGYSFKTDDEDEGFESPFFGGAEDGVTTSVQADYWGTGAFGVQGIGSYNWGSEYLWSRGRLTFRAAQGGFGALHLGGEAVWQGELESDRLSGEEYSATQFGPVLQWVTSPNQHIWVVGAGWKNVEPIGLVDEESTWYAKLEVVLPF